MYLTKVMNLGKVFTAWQPEIMLDFMIMKDEKKPEDVAIAFDKVVKKMLNTPPSPKHSVDKKNNRPKKGKRQSA